MSEIKTVLSLFDGMSCGQIALNKLGIIPEKYYASEVDKYAIQITQKNFPNTIQLGDVNNYETWELLPEFSWDGIDLLIGGSPCQDLSIAKQDRKGLDGERSGLFWRYVEILRKAKPKYFLLENVASMRDKDRDTISEILGVKPIMINSALMSAQQRKRYYWTNIWVTQPNDRKIFLKDIIENGATLTDKRYCITKNYFKKNARDIQKGNTFVIEPTPCALRTRKGRGKVLETKQDGKANSLTTVNTDSMVCAPVRVGHFGNGGQSQRIYSANGKSVCLGTGGGNKRKLPYKYP